MGVLLGAGNAIATSLGILTRPLPRLTSQRQGSLRTLSRYGAVHLSQFPKVCRSRENQRTVRILHPILRHAFHEAGGLTAALRRRHPLAALDFLRMHRARPFACAARECRTNNRLVPCGRAGSCRPSHRRSKCRENRGSALRGMRPPPHSRRGRPKKNMRILSPDMRRRAPLPR